jgi:pSer/pThr/pTyr-binding forkhead associated (FHA) protein
VTTFAIYRGETFVRRLALNAPILKIGRDTRAHLQIDDDAVARMHAVIEIENGALTLIDLGADGGTFVGDERIQKRALAIGDRIRFGAHIIVVEEDGAPARVEIEPRIPTPEIVRDLVGESFSPSEVFGVSAIVLQIDGIRREAWSAETELGEKLFEAYPRGAIAAPVLGVARNFKTIDDAAETHTARCSTCVIRPGFAPCNVCLGSGAGATTEAFDRCIGCEGEGYLRCTACDGSTRVIACAIRYVNDEVICIRRALVPAVHPSIRPFIEARIRVDAPWPKVQAFDPEPSMVASAYRGSSAATRAAEDFHGYFFGDALVACLQTRSEVTTGLARFDMRTFAIPILWTVTRDHHAAYFFDASGNLEQVS